MYLQRAEAPDREVAKAVEAVRQPNIPTSTPPLTGVCLSIARCLMVFSFAVAPVNVCCPLMIIEHK